MAVKLRLSRVGKRGQPSYRVIAIDEHKKRDGRHVEILGSYNPLIQKDNVTLKADRIKYWLSVGAKPTQTVENLIKKFVK